MSLFTINLEKCKRDGICADQCPTRAISFNGSGTVPFPADNAENLCISCGHCVAVCPQGAFTLKEMSPDKCTMVNKKLLPTMEQVQHFMTSRRSIRNFKDKPVDKETINKLLDVANYAPSGKNYRPVHWLVINERQEVMRLSTMVIDWMKNLLTENPEWARQIKAEEVITTWENGYDRISRSAPHIIVAHAKKSLAASQQACTVALAYLELAAYAAGVGACWAGFFANAAAFYEPLKKDLHIPDDHRCFGAMLIGYPKYQYLRIPLMEKPRITWKD